MKKQMTKKSVKTALNLDIKPKLYILMRSDLDSLNMGKGIAQGSHASTAFSERIWKRMLKMTPAQRSADMHCQAYLKWSDGRGFGTVITKDGKNDITIQSAVREAGKNDYFADLVYDPSYPIKDGLVTHHIHLMTCGYIFDHLGTIHTMMPMFRNLELYSK